MLSLRLFKSGDIGIAPYRYISDYPRPLYVPDLYTQRWIELAQIEAYDGAPYILESAETDNLKKLCSVVSALLSSKSSDLEHIEVAQRYFQYSYSYKLTDESHLQDRAVSLIFALEALLLEKGENRGKLGTLGDMLIGDKHERAKSLIEDAYEIRNSVAHGRKPINGARKVDVIGLENCVRHAIKRVIGLATSRSIRLKKNLRQALDSAKSKSGTLELRKDADAPFS
jgi:hypothetical protein